MECDKKGYFLVHHITVCNLFNPMADDDAVDDEETIDKEEMIAEKVWFVIG